MATKRYWPLLVDASKISDSFGLEIYRTTFDSD